MKSLYVTLLAVGLLFSCSHKHGNEAAHARHTEHTSPGGLALNGEERWQADEATNANIQLLQEMMHEHLAQPEANTTEVLNELGSSMQLGFKQVFADCRMKGPEHDMLHVYLLPMLDDVKALEKGDSTKATAARDRLATRLDQYQTYFK